MDIDDFDYGNRENSTVDGSVFSAYANSDLRSHASMIKKGNVGKQHILGAMLSADSFFFETEITNHSSNFNLDDNTLNEEGGPLSSNSIAMPTTYNSVLTFIK